MTTAPSAPLPTLPPQAASLRGRAIQQDGQGGSGAAWQSALVTASQEAQPAEASTAQAGYLLALGNLGAAALQAPWTAPRTPPARGATTDRGGEAPKAQHAEATGQTAPQPASGMRTTFARPPAAVAADASVSTHPTPVAPASVRGAGEHSPASRRTSGERSDHPHATALLRNALPASAAHALTAYAATTSAAAVPSDRDADFSVVPRATSVPVRVHVQWRERVADVWIGLHRQAFDQLPDVRAGVEDWVISRGGVLGHVVCNGETLTRVPPSSDFLGAL
jgi:hypothetical protein